jgi:hypothetical protein
VKHITLRKGRRGFWMLDGFTTNAPNTVDPTTLSENLASLIHDVSSAQEVLGLSPDEPFTVEVV